MTDKYRFDRGSLYEYCKKSDAYIHCYKSARVKTKQAAVRAYEKEMERECFSAE